MPNSDDEINRVELLTKIMSLGLDHDVLETMMNQRDIAGKTPMLLAAENNVGSIKYKFIEILLSNGADPNIKDNEGKTPLWHLVKNGNLEIVKLFLKFKADFNCTYKDGTSLLVPAVFNVDNLDVLKFLVQNIGLDVNKRDKDGLSPLRFATLNNQIDSSYEILKFLLESGADPNARDALFGLTPLWDLVKSCNLKTFELFLKHNADVHLLSYKGKNILCKFYHSNSDVQVLKKLIHDHGLDVNHKDAYDSTPLHSIFNNLEFEPTNMKVIKCLLVNGANINSPDRDGDTPFIDFVRRIRGTEKSRVKREFFDFLIEQVDFSLARNYAHIFEYQSPDYSKYLSKWILEHLAKLKFLNIPVHSTILKFIEDKANHKDYFKKCTKELEAMKKSKPQNSWITFFNLLADERRKLKNYAGNDDMIEDYKNNDWIEMFPVYGESMKINFEKGLKRRKLFDKSCIVLSDCLPIFNPDHLIVKDILDCILSKKDLSLFC